MWDPSGNLVCRSVAGLHHDAKKVFFSNGKRKFMTRQGDVEKSDKNFF